MKIVILGAGQVGSSVAENLVSEQNDITVVDLEPARLRALQDRLDLRTVTGSAAHPSVLIEAGIEDADLLIAVTQSDETNLVACKLAARMFNVPRRIARIRATDFLDDPKVLGPDGFEVDLSICPEQVLTEYIAKLVEFPLVDMHGAVVHRECPLRLQLEDDGEMVPAAQWLLYRTRLGVTIRAAGEKPAAAAAAGTAVNRLRVLVCLATGALCGASRPAPAGCCAATSDWHHPCARRRDFHHRECNRPALPRP